MGGKNGSVPIEPGRIRCASLSECGPVRSENQDAVAAYTGEAGVPVFAVADGLGGHAGGSIASRLAVKRLVAEAAEPRGRSVERVLRDAVNQANLDIFHRAQENLALRNMQSTMTALGFTIHQAVVAHVGDSRVYRVRGTQVDLLTTDHSQAMEMLRLRILTPEQAANHPARSVLTRSLGAELLTRTDMVRAGIQPGDRFLLCTDGLWAEVTPEEIGAVLGSEEPEDACRILIRMALERGSSDNASAVVANIAE